MEYARKGSVRGRANVLCQSHNCLTAGVSIKGLGYFLTRWWRWAESKNFLSITSSSSFLVLRRDYFFFQITFSALLVTSEMESHFYALSHVRWNFLEWIGIGVKMTYPPCWCDTIQYHTREATSWIPVVVFLIQSSDTNWVLEAAVNTWICLAWLNSIKLG